MQIQTLNIDLETKSSFDLAKTGVYRYCESPDFDILLFGVSVNSGPVTVYDLASGEQLPPAILSALTDPAVTKWAYNAAFERVCLSAWLHRRYPGLLSSPFLDPSSWRCTMVWSAYNGLPLSLKQVGAVLKLQDQKLSEGSSLIRFFCVPSRAEGKRWNTSSDDPERWALFKRYNARDVEVELQIQQRLRHYPVPDFLWDQYCLDQRINDRGIAVDFELVQAALDLDERAREELVNQMRQLTDLDNPNSVPQLKAWLAENGLRTESLNKKDVAALLDSAPEHLADVLSLRRQLAKSSVRKYEAIRHALCDDHRLRGMFQFYGANRSGRWAGRLVQLQNLPQNHLEDLDTARALVKAGDYDALKAAYGSVPDVLSQLLRTAFVPGGDCDAALLRSRNNEKAGSPFRERYRFIVADFSAIEARVLSHLAGESWRTRVFEDGGDIYCASASQMFHVPVVKHGTNGHLRQKGKIAELALGYGGSAGALRAMGALEMGLTEEELIPLVFAWREANPHIVSFWWEVDDAVKQAVRLKTVTRVGELLFDCHDGMLFIRLPSGRQLAYVRPKIVPNRFDSESLSYCGLNPQKKWDRIESYGPKVVENITQAISRDLLAHAMMNLSDCAIVGHVHDELIIEAPPSISVEEICRRMSQPPPWLPEISLRADGYECSYYRKD